MKLIYEILESRYNSVASSQNRKFIRPHQQGLKNRLFNSSIGIRHVIRVKNELSHM